MCGLSNDTRELLKKTFAQFKTIESVVLYGSRAKGNFKPGSDIDLSLIGKDLTFDDLLNIRIKLDDLMLPYQFDVSIFHSIKNIELIEHIHRVGLTIYVSDDKQ